MTDADSPCVGPDISAPAARADERCPHCRGAIRSDAPWCTQCWVDLRPPPEPVAAAPAPALVPVGAAPAAALLSGAAPDDAPRPQHRGWPCSGCGAVNAVEDDACVACGTGFLAGLRQDAPPLLALPVVGDITRLSRAQRLGMASAVVLLFALLTVLLSIVAG